MKTLRIVRIVLATLFFVASVAYLALGAQVGSVVSMSARMQILLSHVSTSIGTILIWLVLTLFFGRIYCSTVCPIGFFTGVCEKVGWKLQIRQFPFRYRSRRRWTIHLMLLYIIVALAGVNVAVYLIEPWNMMGNIVGVFSRNAISDSWLTLWRGTSVGLIAGIGAGLVTFIGLATYSALYGGRFCSEVCPIGSALGLLYEHNVYHIEIDPDRCISCGECEDNCPSECVKVVSRYVDNSRCVRCFDCVARCPENAIRYQANRNRRPATPLLRKSKHLSS